MFDETGRDKLEEPRKASKERLRRSRGRVQFDDTRMQILNVLGESGPCLTPGQIRSLIPGPRRSQRSINHQLRMLAADGLVAPCGDRPASE